MSEQRRKVALIAGGLAEGALRLQPWRYLHEVACQLAALGHSVTAISDGAGRQPAQDSLRGVPVLRLRSVSAPRWGANLPLQAALARVEPDAVLLHVGLTSFLHQRPAGLGRAPLVGVFTSPIYSPADLARVGLRRLIAGHRLSGAHLLGTVAPKAGLRRAMRSGALRALVVQTRDTRRRLLGHGVHPDRVGVIPPGVDPAWGGPAAGAGQRAAAGYAERDTVVLYFGSPAPLRGLHTLVRAVELGRRADPSLRLLILSRRRPGELLAEDAELRGLLRRPAIAPYVTVLSGFLDEGALVGHVAASDIVALPFEIIPSDAPLSLLEAQALGKPVVTTTVGCLPELVERGPSYLAPPASPAALAAALLRAAADLRARGGAATRPAARSWRQMGEEWSCLIQSL